MIHALAAVDSRETGVTADPSHRASAMIVDIYPPDCAGYGPRSCADRGPAGLRRADLGCCRAPQTALGSRVLAVTHPARVRLECASASNARPPRMRVRLSALSRI